MIDNIINMKFSFIYIPFSQYGLQNFQTSLYNVHFRFNRLWKDRMAYEIFKKFKSSSPPPNP